MAPSDSRFPKLTFDAVDRVCGRTYAARGLDIFHREQVLGAALADEVGELMGLVLGTAPEPYVQSISLAPETRFANECSCPVGESCKHVAALLYHYIASRDELLRGGENGSKAAAKGEANLEHWLGALSEASELALAVPDEPAAGSHLMLYRIVLDEGGARTGRFLPGAGSARRLPRARLLLRRSRLLLRGGYGKEGAANVSSWHVPDWCTPLDRDIVALILQNARHRDRYGYIDTVSETTLEGTGGARILRLVVESGRCLLGASGGRAVGAGGARALSFDWGMPSEGPPDGPPDALRAGRARLRGTLEGLERWTLVPTEPPWYLCSKADAGQGEGETHGGPDRDERPRGGESEVRVLAGPITAAPSAPLLHALLSGPELDAEGVRRASEFLDGPALRGRLTGARPPLADIEDVEIVDVPPVPVLVLHAQGGSSDPLDFRATFASRYGRDLLSIETVREETHARFDDEHGRRLVRRRIDEEVELARELIAHCPELEPVEGEVDTLAPVAADVPACVLAWRELLASLPDLEALGWEIDTRPPFGLEFERAGSVEADVGESANGWFDLSLAMVHDGQRFALLPLIVEWLEADERERPILVESEEGAWLEIAPEVYLPVAETLIELYDHLPDGESLRLPPQRALLLDALDDAWKGDAVWRGGEALFALAERLKRFEGIARPALPDALEATLRPYQHDGVAWLGFLAEYGFGGILADDMGLGKTLQTLAHLLVERESGRLAGPSLVVAPTSLLGNWQREAERFAPSLRTLVWHGGERRAHEPELARSDLVVTSYALALRDRDLLAEQPFACLVLDEAQVIKNPGSKTAQAVKSLPVARRLCLSGTPLENHLGELWSQFDFLMPDYLGNRDRFTRRFRTPIEKHGDEERQRRLNALVRPFMLRRRKEEVAKDLPPKTDIVQSVTLGAAQSRLYESIRLSMEAKVKKLLAGKGLARSRIELLDALLKLRQTCCHPALVKLPSARKVSESAKTEQLTTMLEELVAEGRRILLFSQFTEMLALIEGELRARSIPSVKLTGRTRRRDRVIDAFQSGEVPLFLISLKAGGTGLNLTAADTVIHYDPWWNPAVEAQASARAHRIGQDKPVFVYRLVAADTVEERILEMQARKQALADATVDGGGDGRDGAEGGTLAGMTADELLGLFAARDG